MGQSGFRLPNGSISTTCASPILGNHRKCKCILIFSEINSTWGLILWSVSTHVAEIIKLINHDNCLHWIENVSSFNPWHAEFISENIQFLLCLNVINIPGFWKSLKKNKNISININKIMAADVKHWITHLHGSHCPGPCFPDCYQNPMMTHSCFSHVFIIIPYIFNIRAPGFHNKPHFVWVSRRNVDNVDFMMLYHG